MVMILFRFAYLLIICISIQACTTPSTESQIDEQIIVDSLEEIKNIEDELKEGLIKLMDKLPNEPNVETVCTYCYSITENDLEVCDSCRMDRKNGTYVLSHEDLRTLNTTICRSCSKIIPELAVACKYCTTFQ